METRKIGLSRKDVEVMRLRLEKKAQGVGDTGFRTRYDAELALCDTALYWIDRYGAMNEIDSAELEARQEVIVKLTEERDRMREALLEQASYIMADDSSCFCSRSTVSNHASNCEVARAALEAENE